MVPAPEQQARVRIDTSLQQAGWHVCDAGQTNIQAVRGTDIPELSLKSGHGFTDRLLNLERSDPLDSLFLKNYNDIRRFSSGGAQPNLNLSHIKATAIPLPSLAEQLRIVTEVEHRLSLIRGTDVQVDTNLQRSERLRQAILQQAFVGRLSMDIPEKETVRDKSGRAKVPGIKVRMQ